MLQGGVILVSHDERLIRMVCKELWVCGGGDVKSIEGGFDEYRKIVEKELAEAQSKWITACRSNLFKLHLLYNLYYCILHSQPRAPGGYQIYTRRVDLYQTAVMTLLDIVS